MEEEKKERLALKITSAVGRHLHKEQADFFYDIFSWEEDERFLAVKKIVEEILDDEATA